MPEPLRILAVGDAGSAHLLRWARRLTARGHEVHVATNRAARATPAELGPVRVHDVTRLDLTTRVPLLRKRRFGPAIGRLASRIDADVMHSHYLLPYGWWAADSGFRPHVVSPWGRDAFVDAQHEPGRSRARRALASADAIVLNSAAIERATLALGATAPVHSIMWHTDVAGFGPDRADPGLRRRFGWPDDALLILSLRNFQPRTNLDVLVRGFARVAAERPQARLVIAARAGTNRAEIETLVDELALRPFVAFHRVALPDLPALVATGDVVVTIASTDSSPSSLLEAMASARPVVGGRCMSIDEWIEQGDGAEMVEPRDEDALVAALLRLIDDPELRRRYGERNARVIAERVEEAASALERVYREAIAARAGSARSAATSAAGGTSSSGEARL